MERHLTSQAIQQNFLGGTAKWQQSAKNDCTSGQDDKHGDNKVSKRIKFVYQDNEAIAHLWIGHNLSGEGQREARNPRRNFYFEDETIYSYGAHFPIASFVRNGKKQAIQFTTRTYSSTTSGHVYRVKGAVKGNKIPVFYLQNPRDCGGLSGIEDYLSRIRFAIAKQIKSRATQRIEASREAALSLKAECQKYCRFWKLKVPKFPAIPALPKDFAQRQTRERERDAAHTEIRRIAYEAHKKQWAIDNADRLAKYRADVEEWNANLETHIADWLAGGELNQPNCGYSFVGEHVKCREIPTLLRIKGDTVETSRYASFPTAHAVAALALVRKVMFRGVEFNANGHTCKVGLFEISKITADGTVYAGCHVVPWESIARIAPALDAMQTTNEAYSALNTEAICKRQRERQERNL
jgi:hypothetical protein